MQKLIAIWSSARGVWEKPEKESLLCEHWEPFSETWPRSGTMLDGKAYSLPTRELPTDGSESLLSHIPEESLLRTPSAIEGDGGAITEKQALEKNRMLQVRDQMAELAAMNGLKVSKSIEQSLFPTPNTMDYLPPRDESKIDRSKGGYANVRETVIREFHNDSVLPTPTATDLYADNMKSSQMSHGSLHSVNLSRLVHKKEIDWGRFLPAIERWEKITGRKAPDPTKPDGKEGSHRLSSSFTEWMMGVEEGFIVGAGVGRREELRACGNGVVPQQAELALRLIFQAEM